MSAPERSWLEPVVATLDAVRTPRRVFFRDDDGGWDDDALARLLDRFERWEVPLDVAAIPSEVTPHLARDLVARCRSSLVHVHQHGYTHTNHEPEGRKCEFGARRSSDRQRADIAAGRALLAAQFGDVLEPVFTPPWNRCGQNTAEIVADLGFTVLSRDHTAAPFAPGTVREVGVTVDWFAKTQGVRWDLDEVGRRIAASLVADRPTGIMLHHAAMGAADVAAVDQLLELVARHPAVSLTHLLALAEEPAAPSRG